MRPDTFDPWSFVKYCLQHGDQYYVRVPRPNPEDEGMMIPTLVPLCELDAQEWVFWVRNWYYTASTGVMTLDQWEKVAQAAPVESL